MANQNLTPKLILKQFMAHVKQDLIMVDQIYRDYDAEIGQRREGDTVYIRAPLNFEVKDGATFQGQDIEQREIPVTVDTRKHIGFEYSDDDLQLSMPEFVRRHSLKEAARNMATAINSDLFSLYKGVYNHVGDPTLGITTAAQVNDAALRLDLGDVPMANRCAVVDSVAGRALGTDAATLSASDAEIASARRKGLISRDLAGFDLYSTNAVRTHTVGTYAGTPLVKGAAQNVTYAVWTAAASTQTLITDGWSSGASSLNQGDTFTIANVYAVNPNTKDKLGHLQQFVVTADASDTTGQMDLTITPAIITSGPYQTVDSIPADNAAITVVGASGTSFKQSLAFHKNAFVYVPVPIKVPDSAVVKATVTDRTGNYKLNGAESGSGLTFAMVKEFDAKTYKEISRIDTLYGKKVLRPELATRFSGSA